MVENDSSYRGLITLVHGTWAPDALWTRPMSKLRKTLQQSLPGIEFELLKEAYSPLFPILG